MATKTAMRIEYRQQRETDAGLLRRGCDACRHLAGIGVRRAGDIFVQIMNSPTRVNPLSSISANAIAAIASNLIGIQLRHETITSGRAKSRSCHATDRAFRSVPP